MELLVSMMIFMIFLGIVGQAYISIVRAQRDANEVRKMYSDVRSVTSLMGEEIRLGSIDYDCYHLDVSALVQPFCPETEIAGSLNQNNTENSFLALVGEGGKEKIIFKLEDGRVWVRKFGRTPEGSYAPAAGYSDGYQALTSEKILIDHLSFAIFPDVNPYSNDADVYSDNGTQFQPKVTIFMSTKKSVGVGSDFDFDFQTTISSRVYSRSSL